MNIGTRKFLLATLVIVFFVQTWFVYSDATGRATPALSGEAIRGRALWLEHNCQACHQIHGFGGFLGPDLTNAAQRLTDARLEAVLTLGAGAMPAFGMDSDERTSIERFLTALNETGTGQLPPRRSFDAAAVLIDAVTESAERDPLDDAEQRGMAILLEQKCIGCHRPNPVAEKQGTDLTTLIGKLGAGGVRGMLETGIPAKGMPRFRLSAEDTQALLGFLDWMGRNADPIHAQFADASADAVETDGLPWFEYAPAEEK